MAEMKMSGAIIAGIILAILVISYFTKNHIYGQDVCILSGFNSLADADKYFRDPFVSNDTRMLRVITYSLMPRPCMTDCNRIMEEARIILKNLYVNKIAYDVQLLEEYLLLIWNDCIPAHQYPADLMLNLKLFRSFRDRLPAPYVNASLTGLRSMMYINSTYSPFFLDCDRLVSADLRMSESSVCGAGSCKLNCEVEPNFSPTTWKRDKFDSLEEAEAYINDPGITDECRLVRAALLVPITTVNKYVTDSQAKLLVEEALMCDPKELLPSVYEEANRTAHKDTGLGTVIIGQKDDVEAPKRSIFSISDLEAYVMGMAKNAGWDYDLATIRKLMYTTELGNPKRASSLENMFFLAQRLPMFKDAPNVRAPHEAWMPADVVSNSDGNLLYQNTDGQIHYPNDYDDAGNPVYVDPQGRVHYLWSPYTNSSAGKAIYKNSSGRAQYPNMINSSGYPYHMNSDGIRHYMSSNANDMWSKNQDVPGVVHDALGNEYNKHNGERFSAIRSAL